MGKHRFRLGDLDEVRQPQPRLGSYDARTDEFVRRGEDRR
jgi:hypothetical protein